MVLQSAHLAGILIVFLLMTGVGIYAGRKVKSAEDFSTGGRKSGSVLVSGTLLGTMVGGAATIGTAQLAFRVGLSAWWFCLGAGLGLAIFASGFGRRLYQSSLHTIPQVLVKTYGSRVGPLASVFTSLGIYFGLVSNMLSFVALGTSVLHLVPIWAAALGVLLVFAYVIFGGIWGTGLTGILKVILVYGTLLYCGGAAYFKAGGIAGLTATFPSYPWFSLFGRGFGVDLASGVSTLLGMISTQTYFQAVASARSLRAARGGAAISALMAPPIGIGAILVGLYMRSAYPGTPSSEVLPAFVVKFLPPVAAGMVLATLFVAVVGCLAGLALGIATMFTTDIYQRYLRPRASDRETLLVQRLILLLACCSTLAFVKDNAGSTILDWNYLSMGLRGCTVIFPLAGAMFFPRWVTPQAGVAAVVLGPLTAFLSRLLFPAGVNPLYPGLAVSLFVLVLVSVITKNAVEVRSTSI
jgi:SSS family solute:Na+ symporter